MRVVTLYNSYCGGVVAVLFSFFTLSKCGGNNLGSRTHIQFFFKRYKSNARDVAVGLNNNDISIDRAM